MDLLKGGTDIAAPRALTPEAKEVITEVEQAIVRRRVWRIDLTVSIQVFVLIDKLVPFAMIAQWNSDWPDPLHVLEWAFLPFRPKKTAPGLFELLAQIIMRTRVQCMELIARDLECITVPVKNDSFEWCLANSSALQAALANYTGQIGYHLPSHPLMKNTLCTKATQSIRASEWSHGVH